MTRLPRAFLFACIAATASCGADSTAVDVTGIVLSETSLSVGVGASAPLLVYEVLEHGASAQRTDGISWTTSNASVASVDEHGVVHGKALGGPITITATRGGHVAHASIVVIPASVEIVPAVATITAGSVVQFTAVALDASGLPLEASAPVWSVDVLRGNQVASITADGRLTMNTPGLVVVSAEIDGQQGSREIGAPGAFDGIWKGTSANGAALEFVVEYGVVSSFRLPTVIRQVCSRQALSLEHGVIGADDSFALSLPSLSNLVTGTFASSTAMSGAYGDIPIVAGCPTNQEGAVPASAFTASRQ